MRKLQDFGELPAEPPQKRNAHQVQLRIAFRNLNSDDFASRAW